MRSKYVIVAVVLLLALAGPSGTVQAQASPCVPSLISPEQGAVLDNGRTDQSNHIIWDFDWSDCEGATHYHLFVMHIGSAFPVIDNDGIALSSYHFSKLAYITDANRHDWTWKVRAKVGGQWGEWSPTRTFDVEPANTDPPSFIVNSTNDVYDGTCGASHCSLREAINAANANAGGDTIAFNIPGGSPYTIQPTSALPTITDPVVIDGYTQPGASPNTNGPGLGSNAMLMIELDGASAGASVSGLTITAGGSTIRGLVINRFTVHGIFLTTNGGNIIEGNFIGTSASGTVALGNSLDGIRVFNVSNATSNTIGGTTTAARNVISGNGSLGVFLVTGAPGNLVQGNFIGTDKTGTADLGNGASGVGITNASSNTVGGTTAPARNVISGNDQDGVQIFSATGNHVLGNFIGTDVTGILDLGNEFAGVRITHFIDKQSTDNTIGGLTAGAGNVISGNGSEGVLITGGAATGNATLSNSIFSNAGLGIDLGSDGVTPNDSGDGDAGANGLQNFSVVTSATTGGGTITVGGTLDSTPSTAFRVELFANVACDPSGNGEGETFLGAATATTDSGGDVSFTVALTKAVAVGAAITASATDPANNTSEFSTCVTAVAAPPVPGMSGPALGVAAALLTGALVWVRLRRGRRAAGTRA